MSRVTHPRPETGGQLRSHRLIVLAVRLALVATAAVVLVLAIGDGASTGSTADRAQPAVRADGGPEETSVAAAVGEQPSATPRTQRWRDFGEGDTKQSGPSWSAWFIAGLAGATSSAPAGSGVSSGATARPSRAGSSQASQAAGSASTAGIRSCTGPTASFVRQSCWTAPYSARFDPA